MTETKTKTFGINSFWLHMIAMALMLCDHLWATVVPGNDWLTNLGRMAFPIFAFMIAEGYSHTKNFKKYAARMLFFAVITEIPFNLMYVSSAIYPFHQNVLWTFLFALLCLKSIDKIKAKQKTWAAVPLSVLVTAGFMLLATVSFCDYGGWGLLTVVMFYLLRGKAWYFKLLQIAAIYLINFECIKGMVIPFEVFGLSFEFPQQGFAIFAMIPILLYNGEKGPNNKFIKFFNYAFYPAHMLLLWAISNFI